MFKFLAISFVMLGSFSVACGSILDSSTPRNEAANAFATATLSGNDAASIKFLSKNSKQNVEDLRARLVSQAIMLEVNNIGIESRLVGTPTPADKLNGRGDLYYYRAKFAFRIKSNPGKWQDGCIWFYLISENGEWFVDGFSDLKLPDFMGNKSTECTL